MNTVGITLDKETVICEYTVPRATNIRLKKQL